MEIILICHDFWRESGFNKKFASLVHLLKQHEITICLETQGSKWQDWFYDIDELTISPKPPSSNMKTDFTILDTIIEQS